MLKKYYTESTDRNKFDKTFSRAELKLLSLVVISIIITAVLITSIFYYYRNLDLKLITTMRSDAIFSLLLDRIPPENFTAIYDDKDVDSHLYNKVQQELDDVRKITAVRYLYTAKRDSEGNAIYVVDGLPRDSEDFRACGSLIEAEILPAVNKCLDGDVFHGTEILKTSWGMIIPSCEPIKSNGVTVGALVIEFDGEYFAENTASSQRYYIIASICVAIGVGFVAIVLIRSFSIPLYQWLAYTDLLTGAMNRNAFELDTHKLRGTEQQKNITVVSCDLNKLKAINDQFGHSAGDEHIRALAQLLMKNFRTQGSTYRIGGDEFVTLLFNASLDATERKVAEICVEARQVTIGNFCLCFSYGIAQFDPEQDGSIDDTISRADVKMYHYKCAKREAETAKTII
ncbi:GGDEF domain-containing protein [Desulfovibrio desulfuricans]|uniref:GGDEF domain-containing protein n=1 Tax=Desulfovibrio desulfuricans TaxID=876 RepID=UPI001F472F1D|nr:GGDEF domain-containing protein [Desulfovibrio desulfuricans]UIA99172.1 GGDEF domain-containing protein [Desulfovibrio desulfuricans]